MRLIDADALIALIKKRLKNTAIIGWLCRIIAEVPTVDAVPVMHGRWIFKRGCYESDECNCSICGQLLTTHAKERGNYCPNCGAKMDGEEQSQKTPLKTLRCVHAESAKENEIGEELVWCERTGRWMNVSLGDCYGQCESQAMEVDGE